MGNYLIKIKNLYALPLSRCYIFENRNTENEQNYNKNN